MSREENNLAERFEVSTNGLRELQAGREPWTIVKELVQNTWDEAPETTICQVDIMSADDGRRTRITVMDDGPGFANPRDAYTLMAPTEKRADPLKRGRFNLGEKEAVSVADEAVIETTGVTIRFPATGGREVEANRQESGTKIMLVMPWSPSEIPRLEAMLKQFRPPNECGLVVNGMEVARREPLKVRTVTLATVFQSKAGDPMRKKNRQTEIHFLEPAKAPGAEGGWLYEMGIPVQRSGLPYDIDVMQKIPMPPNRDTVSNTYIQDIAAETLNTMCQEIPEQEMKRPWVSTALTDKRVKDRKVISVVTRKKFGDKAILASPDMETNRRAMEDGYTLVDPKQIPSEVKGKVLEKGGLKEAEKMFGRRIAPSVEITPDRDQLEFSQWVQELAGYVGLEATVLFLESPEADAIAQCTANTKRPRVTFNVSLLSKDWFSHRNAEQLQLVIHELAHAVANTPMGHGEKWGEACAEVGGKIAKRLGNPDMTAYRENEM